MTDPITKGPGRIALRFVDGFLPGLLPEADGEAIRRGRLLIALSLFVGLACLLFGALYPRVAEPVLRSTSLAIYVAAIGFLLLPFVLKFSGALDSMAVLFTLGTEATIFFMAWNGFGINMPGLFLLPVSVLIGFVLGGRRLGFIAGAGGLIVVVTFVVQNVRRPDQFLAFEPSPFLKIAVLGLGLVLGLGTGWFFETSRVAALKAMREALAEAESANQAKNEFLASMSHELRTPLNSVIGFSRVVTDKEELSASGEDMLMRINRSGRRLLHLVNQILDVAKVEAGDIELDLGVVDVAELVKDVVQELEEQKPRSSVELLAEVPPANTELLTDRVKFAQVINNLTVNALKFTREGSVTIRLVSNEIEPQTVEVIDTGIGISEEKIREIFQPFVQSESGTSRSFDGAGLGLTICQVICEALGYRLEVESELGKGSTFRVVFG